MALITDDGGINWGGETPKQDKVADALAAVAEALATLGRPAPARRPRQESDDRAALADAATVVASMHSNHSPETVARAVVGQMSPDSSDMARATWTTTLRGWLAALTATNGGSAGRFVDTVDGLAQHVARAPSSITRRELDPLIRATETLIANATIVVKVAAARQRTLGTA